MSCSRTAQNSRLTARGFNILMNPRSSGDSLFLGITQYSIKGCTLVPQPSRSRVTCLILRTRHGQQGATRATTPSSTAPNPKHRQPPNPDIFPRARTRHMTALFVYEPIALLDLVLPSLQLEPLPTSQHVGQVSSELGDLLASTELLLSMLAQVFGCSHHQGPLSPYLAAFRRCMLCFLRGILYFRALSWRMFALPDP